MYIILFYISGSVLRTIFHQQLIGFVSTPFTSLSLTIFLLFTTIPNPNYFYKYAKHLKALILDFKNEYILS